jgi:hypothetical protein
LQRRQSAEVTIKGRKFIAAVNSIGELSLTPKDPIPMVQDGCPAKRPTPP